MSGQSVMDRLTAAKHSLAGQGLAKAVCKSTTEEVMGPKRKHLDYLLQCSNEPNVSTPQMADLLIERTQSSNWIIVFKALITIHNLMNYGNEKFFQYLASNNCSLSLDNFLDKNHVQGFDMSTYIRKYAKYVNEKVVSYRALAYDLCKVKKGKEDGLLRTMPADKMLKALAALQSQVDALLEFDATPNDLVNGVISAAFLLICKDLIRLFACYNDGIINLLEKFFGLNRKQCREALDIYKQFLVRMDKISAFLKGAEPWAKKQNAGIDKDDIPDLAKAPASLLEPLEAHLEMLEAKRKKKGKPKSGSSAATDSGATTSNGAGDAAESVSSGKPPQRSDKAGGQLSSGAKVASAESGAVSPKVPAARKGEQLEKQTKPKTKKKSTKPTKESKDSVEPPATTSLVSPKHSAPPRPPPVSKTPQTLSPIHSATAVSTAEQQQSLLLLETGDLLTLTKPSDDLLGLMSGGGSSAQQSSKDERTGSVPGCGAGDDLLSLLQAPESARPTTPAVPGASASAAAAAAAAAAATTATAPSVPCNSVSTDPVNLSAKDGTNTKQATSRSSSPARPVSSNVDLLCALDDPVELTTATHPTAKAKLTSDGAVQMQLESSFKATLQPVSSKAALTVDQPNSGLSLLDFDSSDRAAKALAEIGSAPSGQSCSAGSHPASVTGLRQGSSATVAAVRPSSGLAQPDAVPAAVAVAVASAPSGTTSSLSDAVASGPAAAAAATADLLELLLAPVPPAASASKSPEVVALASEGTASSLDDPLGVNLMAPTASPTVKNADIDLLSLEPEFDPLKTPSASPIIIQNKNSDIARQPIPTQATSVMATTLAAAPVLPALATSPVREPAKGQQTHGHAVSVATNEGARPSPPPYSPRDPIEMAMMKNVTFTSANQTKAMTGKQAASTSSVMRTQEGSKPNASPSLAAGAAKSVLTAGQDQLPKASGASAADPTAGRKAAPEKPLIGADLDLSLMSLASNLTASSGPQRQKSPFQWQASPEKRLTGGDAHAGSSAKQAVSSSHAASAHTGNVGATSQTIAEGKTQLQPKATISAPSASAPAKPLAAPEKALDLSSLDPLGSL